MKTASLRASNAMAMRQWDNQRPGTLALKRSQNHVRSFDMDEIRFELREPRDFVRMKRENPLRPECFDSQPQTAAAARPLLCPSARPSSSESPINRRRAGASDEKCRASRRV